MYSEIDLNYDIHHNLATIKHRYILEEVINGEDKDVQFQY